MIFWACDSFWVKIQSYLVKFPKKLKIFTQEVAFKRLINTFFFS